MTMLIKNDPVLIPACAAVYAAAYREEPWNESIDPDALQTYLQSYCSRPGLHMYAFLQDNVPIGVALVSIIPSIDSDFARIEDFCIAPGHQRKGLGSRFMALICADLRAAGCDSVLLATQRNFPSHHFYIRNGFSPLDSSIQLYREI